MNIIKRLLRRGRQNSGAKFIQKGLGRNLYETPDGFRFWLTPASYVDKCLIEDGVFEVFSTLVVKKGIKPGNVVLDVGANIGYYTVLFSRLVGENGRVLSFEPTQKYRDILMRNISENSLRNVDVYPFGLSERSGTSRICLSDNTATLHWTGAAPAEKQETIELKVLDEIVDELRLDKIDWIKVDIDGHEPAFLNGALKTIYKFNPVLLMEISHPHYLHYGITAWDFYDLMISRGFRIYSEKTLTEYASKPAFLQECGNFAYSANIIVKAGPLSLQA